jgi:hypothetical protein
MWSRGRMTYMASFHRCFAWERAGEFVYLALERCARTLYDAVMSGMSENSQELEEELPDTTLWQIARDTVEGVHVRLSSFMHFTLMFIYIIIFVRFSFICCVCSPPRLICYPHIAGCGRRCYTIFLRRQSLLTDYLLPITHTGSTHACSVSL